MKQTALNETSASRLCTTVHKLKTGTLKHLLIEQE